MRPRVSASGTYVVASVVAAAVIGRSLDQAAVLPGVHEAPAVRAGTTAWLVCVVGAIGLGLAGSRAWSRTGSIRATAERVGPGQVGVFVATEAVVRAATGLGPFDADALVGAALQAALALTLLLALAILGAVVLRRGPVPATPRSVGRLTSPPPPQAHARRPTALQLARAPPPAAAL